MEKMTIRVTLQDGDLVPEQALDIEDGLELVVTVRKVSDGAMAVASANAEYDSGEEPPPSSAPLTEDEAWELMKKLGPDRYRIEVLPPYAQFALDDEKSSKIGKKFMATCDDGVINPMFPMRAEDGIEFMATVEEECPAVIVWENAAMGRKIDESIERNEPRLTDEEVQEFRRYLRED